MASGLQGAEPDLPELRPVNAGGGAPKEVGVAPSRSILNHLRRKIRVVQQYLTDLDNYVSYLEDEERTTSGE